MVKFDFIARRKRSHLPQPRRGAWSRSQNAAPAWTSIRQAWLRASTKPRQQNDLARRFAPSAPPVPTLDARRDWLAEAAACWWRWRAPVSTGIPSMPYWKAILIGSPAIAQRMKAVPGRKTDGKDCEWISDLARHGLIARSFVPPQPIRDLRDLTHYRRKLSQARAAERNRLIKLLERANITADRRSVETHVPNSTSTASGGTHAAARAARRRLRSNRMRRWRPIGDAVLAENPRISSQS